MIKRINKIKNCGVFKDYQRTGDIQDFKKLNLIYGWNYSGKTTISRIFNFLEEEELRHYFTEPQFEILDENNKIYNEDNLELDGKIIRVFNSDFVRKNLEWDGELFDPILLLGKESIQAVKELETKQLKVEQAKKILKDIETYHNTIIEFIEKEFTDKALEVKNKLNLVEPFTKLHLRTILDNIKDNYKNFILTPDEELKLIANAILSDSDKLPTLENIKEEFYLTNLITTVKRLINLIPQFSKTMGYFVENPEIAKWVEQGIKFHDDNDNCEFCGNKLAKQRFDLLLAHFSEDFKNHISQLDQLIEKIDNSLLNKPVLAKRDFYISLQAEFLIINTKMEAVFDEYNKQLIKLKVILNIKKDKPFEAIKDLDNVFDCSRMVIDSIDSINSLILQNNKQTEEFDASKTNALKGLKYHFIAKLIDDILLLSKEQQLILYEKRKELIKVCKNKLEVEIGAIESTINEAQIGSDKLNGYIQSFLGRDEIKVEIQKNEHIELFKIKRGIEDAINLSEGEKTAIAFSFFLTKLLEVPDLKTVIVYIDDPISSLDSNHVFQINALIKDFFFQKNNENESWDLKCDQLFLSTHNYEFFSLLRELPFKKNELVEYYFIKRVSNNTSTLSPLPKAIRNYKSEYHYLFSEIYKFYDSPDKDDFETLMNIPNSVRRFVELYTYSKIPGNWHSTVDERTDKLFGKEKSKRIMKVLHYFSHSNNIDRILNNTDLLCDIENAVNDLMEELIKDTHHFDELKKSL